MMDNENISFRYELIASILIGIATVFGAWVAFESAIWSGISIENYNKGINLMVKANSRTIQSHQQYSLDMLSMIEFRKASGTNYSADDIKNKVMSPNLRKSMNWSDEVNKRVMLEFESIASNANQNMSDQERKALFDRFMAKVEDIKKEVSNQVYSDKTTIDESENWEIQSPKTDPNYEKALFAESSGLMQKSEELTQKAQEAGNTGDKYTLLTVFFTVVLFFAGMSTTIKKESLKIGFIGVGTVLLVISIIRVFMLPMTI